MKCHLPGGGPQHGGHGVVVLVVVDVDVDVDVDVVDVVVEGGHFSGGQHGHLLHHGSAGGTHAGSRSVGFETSEDPSEFS